MSEAPPVESNMDKRSGSRPPPGAGKGAGDKQKHDVSLPGTSKNVPRYPKKKESCNTVPKNRPTDYRKPPPQKSKTFDKRPLTRGYYENKNKHSDDVSEVSNFQALTLAEVGSAQRPGSRKVNLNHLLNFTLTPSDSNVGDSWKSRKWQPYHSRSKSKYTKEQFLHSNCQFLVKHSGDYGAHAADPDLFVDWDNIEQVRANVDEPTSCPICLQRPTAAKVTTCGHIYCWPCMLHYLSLSDKPRRKCPICFVWVDPGHLKSVAVSVVRQYTPGETVTMRLMRRSKGSVVALPVAQWSDEYVTDISMWKDGNLDTQFLKFLVAGADDVARIVLHQSSSLTQQVTSGRV